MWQGLTTDQKNWVTKNMRHPNQPALAKRLIDFAGTPGKFRMPEDVVTEFAGAEALTASQRGLAPLFDPGFDPGHQFVLPTQQ